MSLKKDYLRHNKLRAGPAGWDCQCCNPYACSKRRMKVLARRYVRRKVRQEDQKQNDC